MHFLQNIKTNYVADLAEPERLARQLGHIYHYYIHGPDGKSRASGAPSRSVTLTDVLDGAFALSSCSASIAQM